MIFVVGVPRSGTSMVSGLLNKYGAWVGETVGPAPENPRGFFENSALREGLSKGLLRALGKDPLGVKDLPSWDEVEAFMQEEGNGAEEFRDAVMDAVKEQGYQSGEWLFKDCKMLLTFPLWKAAFPDAKWIIVRRRAGDIIRSCLKTRFMAQHSMNWQFWGEWHDQYVERIEALKESGVWWREVWSQDLVDGDHDQMMGLCDELGLKWSDPEDFVIRDSWHDAPEGFDHMLTYVSHNVDNTQVLENIRSCLERNLPHFPVVKVPHDREIAIVCGGPSLKRQVGSLKRLRKRGGFILATNGVHDWLIRKGIKPDGMAIMDARPDNVSFVKRPRPGVIYFVASQCNPAIFDALKGQDVRVWHLHMDGVEEVLSEHGLSQPMVHGGCTVGLRAIYLAFLMGYRCMHLYGMDSCYSGDEHHAYGQNLNDGERTVKEVVWQGSNRKFTCAVWMAQQAQDFQNMMEVLAPHIALKVHGDGLITEMVRTLEKREAA